jgi:hypothetical protein
VLAASAIPAVFCRACRRWRNCSSMALSLWRRE